jgi:hypothetical protein
MSAPRFTVRKARIKLGSNRQWEVQWAVFDREHRITIAFENYAEALVHRDNIHALYLRYGW